MSETVRREGDPEGPPSVLFDRKKRRLYHLDLNDNPVIHGCPEGFTYDDAGELVPETVVVPEAVAETVEVSAHG